MLVPIRNDPESLPVLAYFLSFVILETCLSAQERADSLARLGGAGLAWGMW